MAAGWDPGTAGVLVLPSGRAVRGRSLRAVTERQQPDFGLYLATDAPEVRGRTGTALACLAVIDGVPPEEGAPPGVVVEAGAPPRGGG